ncbi:unnamed protein product [Rodentolepis nana]|uniref:EF-hand domain-containing protein n=1 Tax=Rodentolepis nana TaxID=102285 RepID=A0A0R3TV33_RODNA|nr:unnamed protein product [Rodentolepis nana]
MLISKGFFARFSKRRRTLLDEVLQSAKVGDKMELTFANWRRAMKSAGYSEMEAAFIFQKYDRDGDNMLDFLECRKMREDFSLGLAFQPMDSDDEEKTKDTESTNLDSNKDVFADREDCEELNERIVQVEEGMNNIVRQISSIIGNIERTERARRENEHALMKGII